MNEVTGRDHGMLPEVLGEKTDAQTLLLREILHANRQLSQRIEGVWQTLGNVQLATTRLEAKDFAADITALKLDVVETKKALELKVADARKASELELAASNTRITDLERDLNKRRGAADFVKLVAIILPILAVMFFALVTYINSAPR